MISVTREDLLILHRENVSGKYPRGAEEGIASEAVKPTHKHLDEA